MEFAKLQDVPAELRNKIAFHGKAFAGNRTIRFYCAMFEHKPQGRGTTAYLVIEDVGDHHYGTVVREAWTVRDELHMNNTWAVTVWPLSQHERALLGQQQVAAANAGA